MTEEITQTATAEKKTVATPPKRGGKMIVRPYLADTSQATDRKLASHVAALKASETPAVVVRGPPRIHRG